MQLIWTYSKTVKQFVIHTKWEQKGVVQSLKHTPFRPRCIKNTRRHRARLDSSRAGRRAWNKDEKRDKDSRDSWGCNTAADTSEAVSENLPSLQPDGLFTAGGVWRAGWRGPECDVMITPTGRTAHASPLRDWVMAMWQITVDLWPVTKNLKRWCQQRACFCFLQSSCSVVRFFKETAVGKALMLCWVQQKQKTLFTTFWWDVAFADSLFAQVFQYEERNSNWYFFFYNRHKMCPSWRTFIVMLVISISI